MGKLQSYSFKLRDLILPAGSNRRLLAKRLYKNMFSKNNSVEEGYPLNNSVEEDRPSESIWDNSREQYCKNDFKLYWELLPAVVKYQLKSMTGSEYVHYFEYLINYVEQNIGKQNLRGLFIGCLDWDPAPEWTLVERGLFNKIEVFDIAEGLLKKQAKLTAERGIKNIEYRNFDCNYLQLEEGAYDMIFAIGTIHHIEKLDILFSQINRGLKNNGIFAMREYVGPNRFQFTEEQVFIINEILAILPEKYKQAYSGTIKNVFAISDVKEIIKLDPSESVCSQDIVPVMKEHLDVIQLDYTGGTILHPLLNDIASNFERDEDGEAILKLLILFEKTLIEKGVLPSDYVFSMAKKRLH